MCDVSDVDVDDDVFRSKFRFEVIDRRQRRRQDFAESRRNFAKLKKDSTNERSIPKSWSICLSRRR